MNAVRFIWLCVEITLAVLALSGVTRGQWVITDRTPTITVPVEVEIKPQPQENQMNVAIIATLLAAPSCANGQCSVSSHPVAAKVQAAVAHPVQRLLARKPLRTFAAKIKARWGR